MAPTAGNHQVRSLEKQTGLVPFESRTCRVMLAQTTIFATVASTTKWLLLQVARFTSLHPSGGLKLQVCDKAVICRIPTLTSQSVTDAALSLAAIVTFSRQQRENGSASSKPMRPHHLAHPKSRLTIDVLMFARRGAPVLWRSVDLAAQNSGSVPGPPGIVEQAPAKGDDICLTFLQD